MHRASLKCLLAIAGVFVLSTANASVLTRNLTFDGPAHLTPPNPAQGGGEDLIEDDSQTKLLDLDSSGSISLNDVVYGVINITTADASAKPANGVGQLEQITIVFSAKITGAGTGGSFALSAIGDSTKDYDLRNLLSASIVNDFTIGPNNNSIFVVMSNEIGNTESGGINPLNLNANIGGAVDANSIKTNITNTNGWTGDAIGGLLAGNFFEFLPTGGLTGIERGGFTIQENTFGGLFLPVDVNNFGGATTNHNITLDTGNVNGAGVDAQALGWTFRDKGDFFVNALALPEPTSIGVWSVLMLFGMTARRSRLRK